MRTIKSNAVVCFTALGLLALLSGCLTTRPSEVDVTNKPEWWGILRPNQLVRLKADALLYKTDLDFTVFNYDKKNPMHIPLGVPITADMVKAEPQKYWAGLHVVQAGTRLRLCRLVRYQNTQDTGYLLYAEIMDGEFKGKIVRVPFAIGSPKKPGTLRLNPYLPVEPVD